MEMNPAAIQEMGVTGDPSTPEEMGLIKAEVATAAVIGVFFMPKSSGGVLRLCPG